MVTADESAAFGAIAQHYQTGKYCDLRLVAKDGTIYNVHRVIVCSHSPILGAQATNGGAGTTIQPDDDATTLQHAIEWMYGIDKQRLLIDGKTVDEVTNMGPAVAYGEILALTDLAVVADKVCVSYQIAVDLELTIATSYYRITNLKRQATDTLKQLVKSLTSLPCIIGAIRQLAPEGVVGAALYTMATHALDLAYMQQGTFPTRMVSTPRSHRETPKSLSQVAEKPLDRSSATLSTKIMATTSSTQDETDSDVPLIKRIRKEKTNAYLPRPPESSEDPEAVVFKDSISWEPRLQPANNSKRARSPTTTSDATPQQKLRVKANEPFRISTALPANDPPQGPHCHCYASESDQTPVKCDSCGSFFHPRCIGKGKYAKGNYGGDKIAYMMKDKEKFEDEEFKCGDCEAGFFGGK